MKKRRIRYDRILILVLVILVIVVSICLLVKPKKVKMINFVNKNISEVESFSKKNNLELVKDYQYSDDFEKDIIINQSIEKGKTIKKNDQLKVIVSLGKLDINVYKEYNVNELGRIPIMMYHGIHNLKNEDTGYTGGNIDKDGYQRTKEAFINDLEFYYQNGYRMIKLKDYVNGIIDVPLGKSPIVLTFDDGLKNNIIVTGLDENGEIIIDPNSAVGILESFKQKYPDFNVTATFFINGGLFEQPLYNEKIIKWLINNGYDIGNHTYGHSSLDSIDSNKVQEEVGKLYQKLDQIIPGQYLDIVALPFGKPYKKDHENFNYILNGSYNNQNYTTISTLRVGWESDYSPFSKSFDKTFIKRVRAYDNNGNDYDIEMNFKQLEKTRYISDGNKDTVVIKESDASYLIENIDKQVIKY